MTYEFKKAVREEVGLLIGLISPSGGGKTYSAMRIASGIVGKGNRFAVIDTEEEGRYIMRLCLSLTIANLDHPSGLLPMQTLSRWQTKRDTGLSLLTLFLMNGHRKAEF